MADLTRYLPSENNPYRLNARVDVLFPDGVNRHILHVIRYKGNDAAHESNLLTQDDARMILSFTESFLKSNSLRHDA